MKGTLALNGRCPKCTLKPPCKHFDSVEQLNSSVSVQDSKGSVVNATSQSDAKRQGTPDRGVFYPEQQSMVSGSGISMTTDSNTTHQRSDGFSVTSNIKPPIPNKQTLKASG